MIGGRWPWLWADRTFIERWLIGCLVAAVICLILVLGFWITGLRPVAPVWGTGADWVAAVATVLGFGSAVFTLTKNANDQKRQREEDIWAEAAQVSLTLNKPKVDFHDSLASNSRYSYWGQVDNAASSPIRRLSVELHVTKLSNHKKIHFLECEWELGTVRAGGEAEFLIQVTVRGSAPSRDKIFDALSLSFMDVHGNLWEQASTRPRPVKVGNVLQEQLD